MKSVLHLAAVVPAVLGVSGSCHEIYGTQKGAKLEIHHDPATGTELEREDG